MKHEKEAIQYKLQHQGKFLFYYSKQILPCKIRMSKKFLVCGKIFFPPLKVTTKF